MAMDESQFQPILGALLKIADALEELKGITAEGSGASSSATVKQPSPSQKKATDEGEDLFGIEKTAKGVGRGTSDIITSRLNAEITGLLNSAVTQLIAPFKEGIQARYKPREKAMSRADEYSAAGLNMEDYKDEAERFFYNQVDLSQKWRKNRAFVRSQFGQPEEKAVGGTLQTVYDYLFDHEEYMRKKILAQKQINDNFRRSGNFGE